MKINAFNTSPRRLTVSQDTVQKTAKFGAQKMGNFIQFIMTCMI